MLAEGGEFLAGGEGFLDRPAPAGDLDQGGQQDRGR
jgi:hypothetical protein